MSFLGKIGKKFQNGAENLKNRILLGSEAMNSKDSVKRIFRLMDDATVQLGDYIRVSIREGAFKKHADSPLLKVNEMSVEKQSQLMKMDEVIAYTFAIMGLGSDNLNEYSIDEDKKKTIISTIKTLFYKCESCTVDRVAFIQKIKEENVFAEYDPHSLEPPSFLRHAFADEEDQEQPTRFSYQKLKTLLMRYTRFANAVSNTHKLFHKLQADQYSREKKTNHDWVKSDKVKARRIHETRVNLPEWFEKFSKADILKEGHPFWGKDSVGAQWQSITLQSIARKAQDAEDKKLVEKINGKVEMDQLSQDPTISWIECEEALFKVCPGIDDSSNNGDSKIDSRTREIMAEYLSDHSNVTLEETDSKTQADSSESTTPQQQATPSSTFKSLHRKSRGSFTGMRINNDPDCFAVDDCKDNCPPPSDPSMPCVVSHDSTPVQPPSSLGTILPSGFLNSVVYDTQPTTTPLLESQRAHIPLLNDVHLVYTLDQLNPVDPPLNTPGKYSVFVKYGLRLPAGSPKRVDKATILDIVDIGESRLSLTLVAKLPLGFVGPDNDCDFQIMIVVNPTITPSADLVTDAWSPSLKGTKAEHQVLTSMYLTQIRELELRLHKQQLDISILLNELKSKKKHVHKHKHKKHKNKKHNHNHRTAEDESDDSCSDCECDCDDQQTTTGTEQSRVAPKGDALYVLKGQSHVVNQNGMIRPVPK